MLLILSSFDKNTDNKNVVSEAPAPNGLVLSPADGDAGAEGGEEGPV